MLERRGERRQMARLEECEEGKVVDVGILTRGKATLGITLSSLLLQDTANLRIHIVDTGDSPVVNREDVTLAMRLAFDREIHCSYERLKEKRRAFSLGRLRLLETLRGPHICFVDDDMALNSVVVARLLATAGRHPRYGCIRPQCVKATAPLGSDTSPDPYVPGGLLFLDEHMRALLTRYYADSVDVVDATKSSEKVWEVAFLSEVLRQLGRPCFSEPDAMIYHLDYHEINNWSLSDPSIMRRSVALARTLVGASEGRSVAV